MRTNRYVLMLAIAAALASAAAMAQAPARVGQDRPITRQWKCENGRELLLNFNPIRPKEEAWLTYAGNRVEVHRVHKSAGIAYASKDGKVKLHEEGDEGIVEFAGIADKPVRCSRIKPARK